MLTVAYITNEFPVAVEPYVVEEICELRRCGVRVIPSSVRRPRDVPEEFREIAAEALYLQPFSVLVLARAAWLCVQHWRVVADLFSKALIENNEPFCRCIRAALHTLLGVYYAAMLRPDCVSHIHVHHGYFASWIAMTAARILGITYSMTLHGSDLLLHRAYLNLKLQNCKFCLTVSEFNRQHILANYPKIAPEKICIQRMGVDALDVYVEPNKFAQRNSSLVMLSVGRLHPVKDHAFLLRACRELKLQGVQFICMIAGEGPERTHLERLIIDFELQDQVTILGHVPRAKLETYYAMCDLVVLTSRSEGVPLTLMEAMAHGRTVLAPAITGIPELVVNGLSGFLYRPGSIEDFVNKLKTISAALPTLNSIRQRAREHVLEKFNRTTNLAAFAQVFPALIEDNPHANPILQQI